MRRIRILRRTWILSCLCVCVLCLFEQVFAQVAIHSKGANDRRTDRGIAEDAPPLLPDPNIAPIRRDTSLARQRSGLTAPNDRQRLAKSTRVSNQGSLSASNGQFWREYDIQEYVQHVQTVPRPQQTVVDWIIRETGTDTWFHQGGVLNATRTTISVYHNEEVQRSIGAMIDRFTSAENQRKAIAVRLCTLGPDWRKSAWRYLTPVPVETAGIEAWLLSKEASALLLAQIRSRPDFREHHSPNLMIRSGHAHTIERFQPRNYVQGVDTRAASPYGYGIKTGQVKEGYSLKISPLASDSDPTFEAVIKCTVEQIERMTPIMLDVSNGTNPNPQTLKAQVPQISSWKIHERFRWPEDQVLLISRGVVAMPGFHKVSQVPGLPNIVKNSAPRADALLFLQAENLGGEGLAERRTDFRTGQLNYRGRY